MCVCVCSLVWCARYYELNPGLKNGANMTIAFQPEVGASAAPVHASLRRFLNATSRAAFPSDGTVEPADAGAAAAGGIAVGASWTYHNYEGAFACVVLYQCAVVPVRASPAQPRLPPTAIACACMTRGLTGRRGLGVVAAMEDEGRSAPFARDQV